MMTMMPTCFYYSDSLDFCFPCLQLGGACNQNIIILFFRFRTVIILFSSFLAVIILYSNTTPFSHNWSEHTG